MIARRRFDDVIGVDAVVVDSNVFAAAMAHGDGADSDRNKSKVPTR